MNTDGESRSGWVGIAALLGMLAVGLGAIASHALIDPKAVASVEKAALYQLMHAVVLLFASQLNGRFAQLCRWLFLVGIALFSGSIEIKYLFALQNATVVAPAGGICLMLGWVALGVAGFRQRGANTATTSKHASPTMLKS